MRIPGELRLVKGMETKEVRGRNNNHSKKLSMKGTPWRRQPAGYLSVKGQIEHLHILLQRTCVPPDIS